MALVAIITAFSILAPTATFLSVYNIQNIANDSAVVLIFAAGATLVIIGGGLDLSQGSVAAFAAVLSVEAMKRATEAGMAPWPTIALGALVAVTSGAAWGVLNGWLISRPRLDPFIVTLGSFGAALGAARLITHGVTISGTPADLNTSIGLGIWLGVPVPFLIAMGCVAAFGIILAYTRTGEHIYLLGSNEEAARRAGIDVKRHVFKLYVWSGGLAGVAGFVDVARFAGASPTGYLTEVFTAIAGVVIGGASLIGGGGLMLGSVIGVFIPTVLNNGLIILQIERFWQEIVVGIILVAAVGFDQWRRGRELST